jgi:hypothetical protein
MAMRKILLLLLLSALFIGSEAQAAPSRTSGVAPLSVHFFSDFVDSASGDERIDRFHHYDYTWDFGDTGSGNWGTNGKSKNMAKGAVATHIFEEPGVYNVTLTIRDHTGIIGAENYSITVSDPDLVYSGTQTTCVNVPGDSDFTGAPTGSRHVSTNDLSTITQYATAGSRVLFKRGSSWTVASTLSWPGNAGPVTIGAYGNGSNPDALGIYSNNPQITVTNDGRFIGMDSKQDWRVMDLHLIDTTRTYHAITGAESMQRQLFLRLKIEGFVCGLVWSHWNDSHCMSKDQMVVASCDVSDSESNALFGGSERLAILGNIFKNTHQSQVVRLWLTNHGVVEHNLISGSSLDLNTSGREGLKFHSPDHTTVGEPVINTGIINAETEYSIISDNVIGTSGPFPIIIGSENNVKDERVSNIIIERNRICSDYGNTSGDLPQISLNVWSRYTTVRNNIMDGTGSKPGYIGIAVYRQGVSPIPAYNEIYNNTIYRGDASSDIHRGIHIESTATLTTVRNNLMSFPYATGYSWQVNGLVDEASDTVSSNNLFTDTAGFIDPNNAAPLSRYFNVVGGSPGIDSGYSVPVYEDYDGNIRPNGNYDIGAYEYGASCPYKAVHIKETSDYYDTVSAAYAAASSGQTILMQEKSFIEDLSLTGDSIVTLKGGYDCNYNASSGFTTLSGIATIGGLGKVTVDRVIIR